MTSAYLLVAESDLCRRCLRVENICAVHGCDLRRHRHRAPGRVSVHRVLLVGAGVIGVLWLAATVVHPSVLPVRATAAVTPAEVVMTPAAALPVELPALPSKPRWRTHFRARVVVAPVAVVQPAPPVKTTKHHKHKEHDRG